MEFFSSFARLGLAPDLAHKDASHERLPAPTQRLLASLQAEAEAAAVKIAISSSIANALACKSSPCPEPAILAHYSPPDQALFTFSAGLLLEAGVASDLLSSLQDMTRAMTLAKQMTKWVTAGTGPADATCTDIEAVAEAWRRAAAAARAAIARLTKELERQQFADRRPAKGLLRLLELASGRDFPCVRPNGEIGLPEWADRRRHRRIAVDQPAVAWLRQQSHPVRLIDASEGGVAISGLNSLRRGEALGIKLADGRRLPGIVVWIAGDRAGVRFDVPLPPSDPLISPVGP